MNFFSLLVANFFIFALSSKVQRNDAYTDIPVLEIDSMHVNNGELDTTQMLAYKYTLYNTHPKKAVRITRFFTECSGVTIKRKRLRIAPLGKASFTVWYNPVFTTGKFNKTVQLFTTAALRNKQDNTMQLPQYNYNNKKLYMVRLMGYTKRKLQFKQAGNSFVEPESYFLKKDFLEANGPIAILQTASSVVNLGNVPEGPIKTFRIEFKNVGNAPAIISQCQTSCGCIIATWPRQPILPGQSGTVIVDFLTQGRPGMCNKTVTVNTLGYIYCGKETNYLPSDMSINLKAITMQCFVVSDSKVDTNRVPPFLRH